ncbi:unnamed protein product [Caretta caretta]
MSDSNTTNFTNPSTFILLGIPGLEATHVWISIPFSATYAVAILRNVTILFIVKREPSLHGPMYYFLCMLAVINLIDFNACLTQLYFIHCFSGMESGIFVAMALDRYVAICHPLRHSTILTNLVVAKIGLSDVQRGGMFVLCYLLLARRWPYCRANILPHTHCEHMAMVRLACTNTHISSYYCFCYSL